MEMYLSAARAGPNGLLIVRHEERRAREQVPVAGGIVVIFGLDGFLAALALRVPCNGELNAAVRY